MFKLTDEMIKEEVEVDMKTIIEQIEKAGFTEIKQQNDEISCISPSGKSVWIKAVFSQRYYPNDILHMKEVALSTYDMCIFLCNVSEYKQICEICGNEFCVSMGKMFSNISKRGD